MRRLNARLAAASALAVATAVCTSGAAFAGGGHGDHGNGNGGGQSWSSQPQQQQQPSGGHDSHAQQQQPSGGHDSHGQQQQQPTTTTTQQQEQGVKPSSTTSHWTHTKVGSSPDVSKRYGNGKTAAQIAKSKGAPDSADLTGPGNSQPHKIADCRHKSNRSGGVDVHAYKGSASCETKTVKPEKPAEHKPAEHKPAEHKPAEQTPAEHKITICHATGSSTNPYVLITVDKHSLEHGHTAAKGDIVPAPAGGCPSAAPAAAVPNVSFCDMESSTSGKLETKPADKVVSHELNGTPEEARDIVPPFSFNGKSYSQNWDTNGQSIFNNGCKAVAAQAPVTTTTTAQTTTQAEAAVTTTATVPATTTVTVTTTTPVTVTTNVAATTTTTVPQLTPVTETTTPAQGGVLGAQTSLASPKKSNGGVLGTVGNVAGSTLPFTGFPVWLAVLVAFALILAGIALRRRTLGTRP